MQQIQQRKEDHLALSLNPQSQIEGCVFSKFRLPYRALPELNMADVDTSTTLFGKKLRQPLIIASMTGGVKHAVNINSNLARVAQEKKIALGVGSQRVALVIPEAVESFVVIRKLAPDAVIFANMAAVQLNYGYGLDEYRKVVDMVKADALYLHLNPLQEAIQPEGDTNFEGLLGKIEKLVKVIGVPVFAKEVGHGIDQLTAKRLVEIGVSGIDVAGASGTSWAWIEGKRKGGGVLAEWFKDFGIVTEKALLGVRKLKDISIVASGGIRNPIQGLIARALGADYYSSARPFLDKAIEGEDSLTKFVDEWEMGLRIAMFVSGVKNWVNAKNLILDKD